MNSLLSAPQTADLAANPDDRHLATFQAKLRLLRDRVRSVANNYQTAAYIVGRAGIGKSFTVAEELKNNLWGQWEMRTARMTPLGLFRFFAEHPDHTLVLDDVGGLFDNKVALPILLAALDGQPGEARRITYQTKTEKYEVLLRGGVIAISNAPLRDDPLAKALASRIVVLEHEATDAEIAAFLRHMAARGCHQLTSEEASEVVEFLIAETRSLDLRLDLRCLAKAARDFRQQRDGHADTPWQELVRSSLRKLAEADLVPLISKNQEIEQQRQRIRELIDRYPDDTDRQIRESGLKKSTFYTRRREVLLGR